MKTFMVTLLVVAAAGVPGHGQGTIYINNTSNTGVYDGAGGTTANPVYSYLVKMNGLIFTWDPAEQAGNLGGPAGSQLMGDDFSWALYGGSTAVSVNTLIASETGSQIVGDNQYVWWGQFEGNPNEVSIPGTQADSTVYLELYAWEGDTFPTYEQALEGMDYTGDSGVFANPSGGGWIGGATLTGMPDIFLSPPIPEPYTMTLLATGGALALLSRRNRG
jgi:hypothetical protein